MRGRATSVVLPALAVLALVTVVGIAATGSTPHGSDRSRTPSHSFLDALFTLWLVALAAGAVLLVYGLMQRKAIAQELASGRHRRTSIGALVAFVLVVTVVVRIAGYLNLRPKGEAFEEETGLGDGQLPPTGRDHKPIIDYHPGISWLVVAVVVALALAAVCAYVISQRRSRTAADASEELAEQLAPAPGGALGEPPGETGPRR